MSQYNNKHFSELAHTRAEEQLA